jgi:formylglycine-generating enzyme required for sulfatase activity
MGSEDFYPEERTVHAAHVEGFWMDEHPVTVAELRRFIKATGHNTMAEIAPNAVDFPNADRFPARPRVPMGYRAGPRAPVPNLQRA